MDKIKRWMEENKDFVQSASALGIFAANVSYLVYTAKKADGRMVEAVETVKENGVKVTTVFLKNGDKITNTVLKR